MSGTEMSGLKSDGKSCRVAQSSSAVDRRWYAGADCEQGGWECHFAPIGYGAHHDETV
jgi:hypothetical protein